MDFSFRKMQIQAQLKQNERRITNAQEAIQNLQQEKNKILVQ